MSRSVSAPSSVTKTSPCWNGDIVPGSTLMYGSNFCIVTASPRSTSRRPNEAAAMPFPREETTPPVTKMYLVAFGPVVIDSPLKCVPVGFRPSKVIRRVDARERRLGQPAHADREPTMQRPELLQPLRLFRRARPGTDPALQCRAGVRVEAHVLPVESLGRLARIAPMGNDGPGEVQGATTRVGDHLD